MRGAPPPSRGRPESGRTRYGPTRRQRAFIVSSRPFRPKALASRRSGAHGDGMKLVRLLCALPLVLSACVETGTSAIVDEPDVQPIREEPDPDEREPGAPFADAGEDREVAPLEQVRLDATGSFDPAGLDLIPEWRLVSAPQGSRAVLEQADAFRPEVFADIAGTYVFELSVTNTDGIRSKHPDQVVLHAVPQDALYVQLTWDVDVDLDLHLVPVDEPLWGRADCSWCNPQPEWGAVGVRVDDPSLDWDAIHGFGPETTTILAPAEGRYRVAVDLYGQGGLTTCRTEGCPVTSATLDVYVDGERVQRSLGTLEQAGELWEALEIVWSDEGYRIVEVDEIGWTEINDCQGS